MTPWIDKRLVNSQFPQFLIVPLLYLTSRLSIKGDCPGYVRIAKTDYLQTAALYLLSFHGDVLYYLEFYGHEIWSVSAIVFTKISCCSTVW